MHAFVGVCSSELVLTMHLTLMSAPGRVVCAKFWCTLHGITHYVYSTAMRLLASGKSKVVDGRIGASSRCSGSQRKYTHVYEW